MDILNAIKLDSWWKVVLWAGIALVGSALIFNIEIINRKHLVGLGIGMFLIGLSNFAALKTVIIPETTGYWETKKPIHNTKTRIVLYIGWILAVVFGSLLLWSLF